MEYKSEIYKVIYQSAEEKPVSSLKSLVGVETPIADSLLGVAANLGNITLDEIREERLAKYSV